MPEKYKQHKHLGGYYTIADSWSCDICGIYLHLKSTYEYYNYLLHKILKKHYG